MDVVAHHLGLALGGRPAARMTRRLSIPLSADSFLRLIRRRARIPSDPLRVVSIDDWAWKRGQRYGTVHCDLERRRIVDLLPNRDPATIEAWQALHQGIEIITRDRSRGTVRRVVRGGRTDVFRTRESSLDPYTDKLKAEWQGGCHVGAELWRDLQAAGSTAACGW